MEKHKTEDITKKLQNLVRLKKTPRIIYKAGSNKYAAKTSNRGSSADAYYPTHDDD